jgi:hypothetical protein
VHLQDVDDHAAGGEQPLVAQAAFVVLCFLVLHKHLLVGKLALAVVAPRLGFNDFVLLLPHRR